jgi:hypothetical protein
MPLKLRPSGLGSGIDKGRQDYETREGPEKHLRWFRSFAVQGPMTRADRVATFEEAKAQFLKSCDACMGEAGRGALNLGNTEWRESASLNALNPSGWPCPASAGLFFCRASASRGKRRAL